MNPVIYIFMNKSLGMSAGKLAAQAAHAAVVIGLGNNNAEWLNYPHRTILIMQARDEAHMHNIAQYLKERGIKTTPIIDEGVNEIDPHVWTALATDILDKDDDNVAKSLSTFKLFRDTVRLTVEVDK